jgi:magnesium-transporting ATPase (P-type)
MFAIIGSAITGTSPLNTRQLLLVNTMTDALPAAALAVSKPSGPIDARLRGADQPALWQAVAIRGVTTAAATTAAWAMAGLTGPPLPRRASTTALVALVGTELGQTLLESQAPMVVLTTLGSLGLIGVLISTPGVSQLLGCTPLDPLGWAQGLGAATVATIATGLASRALPGPDKSAPEPPEASADPDEPGDRDSGYRRPQRATAAHTVPVTAP